MSGNIRFQFFAGIAVLVAAAALGVSRVQFLILILVVCAMLVLECVNSALEHFLDMVKPRLSDQVKIVKDISAGAVLIAALGSVWIGWLIFSPVIRGYFIPEKIPVSYGSKQATPHYVWQK